MALANRMAKELKMLRKAPPEGVCAWPEEGSTTRLVAQLQGPSGTVYEAGVFRLAVEVPERYPFEPPKVTFTTRVFHPNIDASGRVCLDVLDLPPKGSWRPSLNLVTVLAAVRQLLAEPNPDDPLDHDATEAYLRNRAGFDSTARRMVAEHASGAGMAAAGVAGAAAGVGAARAAATTSGAQQQQQQQAEKQEEQQQQEEGERPGPSAAEQAEPPAVVQVPAGAEAGGSSQAGAAPRAAAAAAAGYAGDGQAQADQARRCEASEGGGGGAPKSAKLAVPNGGPAGDSVEPAEDQRPCKMARV